MGFIRIGTGRDAADASFATLFGAVQMEQMQVFVEPVEGAEDVAKGNGKAIATT
jgi:hypothetical protein